MSITVKSYAAMEPSAPLQPHQTLRRELWDDDVLVKILYSGVCHTDIHAGSNHFGNIGFPLVPGHEMVGVVEKVGSKVTKHKVGDIVGSGVMSNSCGECNFCEKSYEMFCLKGFESSYGYPEVRFPGHVTAGFYSEQVIIQEKFVLSIPKALQDPKLLPGVAPIFCAGVTMYSPMRQSHIGPGSKVGIAAAFGGLGHMGVKLAKALGAEVYIISRSHTNDALAEKLGATKVIQSTDEEELKANAGLLDLIIDTIPADHDVNPFFGLLQPYGGLTVVGHIGVLGKDYINTAPLIYGNRRLQGSIIGGIAETQEVLELCAKAGIASEFKLINMEQVNDAWKTLQTQGGLAYRFVIDVEKFRDD